MVDLGENTSSLWVATGVATVLGKALQNMVHVLAVRSNASQIHPAPEKSELDSPACSWIVEHIADSPPTADGMNELADRLSATEAFGRMAIVWLPQLKEKVINFPRMDFVDDAIPCVRAAQTRRAALEAIERQLCHLWRAPNKCQF